MIANADSIRIPVADGVVQCVVTSPPYWGLRAYSGEQERVWPDGWRGGLGLEPTPELFIEHMVQVFREVRRVMRDDAVAWVNMGDCFNDKQLVMIPHRLALALQADGWWVRSDVVWAKPNPMPESLSGWRWEQCKVKVTPGAERLRDEYTGKIIATKRNMTDQFLLGMNTKWQDCTGCPRCAETDGLVLRRGSWRPTSSHEYVFMLAKSATYFSDGEAVREQVLSHNKGVIGVAPHGTHVLEQGHRYQEKRQYSRICGANCRSVWNIATQPYPGAHFATFPTALAQRCVLASTSRHACAECGAPWARVVEVSGETTREKAKKRGWSDKFSGNTHGQSPQGLSHAGSHSDNSERVRTTLDHRPSCGCGAGVRPCIVLDPFCGSGTVGQVCRELPHKRRFVGLDVSFDYLRDQALVRSERRTPASKLAELPMFT
jgi:DNA modification methylase